jgi:hypothetical protein
VATTSLSSSTELVEQPRATYMSKATLRVERKARRSDISPAGAAHSLPRGRLPGTGGLAQRRDLMRAVLGTGRA